MRNRAIGRKLLFFDTAGLLKTFKTASYSFFFDYILFLIKSFRAIRLQIIFSQISFCDLITNYF